MTSRFNDWPLPDTIQPWRYDPEHWVPQPELNGDLLWRLAEQLGHVGADDLDVGSTPAASSVADEDEDTFEMDAGVTVTQIQEMVQGYKDSKKPDPTDDGSTTVGTGTTVGTASSAGTATTTGTTSTTPSGASALL